MLCLFNVGLWIIIVLCTRKAQYFDGFFFFATNHRQIFCSSWSWGRNLYCSLEIRVLINLFPNYRPEYDIERVRYCQQDYKSVSIKTFDQPEHDSRIWYHGMVPSKECLQASPPFPPPHTTASYLTRFLAFFPYCRAWSQATNNNTKTTS